MGPVNYIPNSHPHLQSSDANTPEQVSGSLRDIVAAQLSANA